MVWQGFAGGNVTEVFLRDFYFDGFPCFQYVRGRGESESFDETDMPFLLC